MSSRTIIYRYICRAWVCFTIESLFSRFVRSATSCATAKDISPDISRIYNGFIVVTDNALYATQCDANIASLDSNEKIYYRCQQQWSSE